MSLLNTSVRIVRKRISLLTEYFPLDVDGPGGTEHAVSQSAGNQKEEMDQQSSSVPDATATAADTKKSMAFWAGGKRVETTCRVLFGESPIRKKDSWIAGPKRGPNRAARRLRLDRNDGMPSRRVPKYPSTFVAAAAKSPFTTSPFRGDFFWESEKKGMRNPIRPSSRRQPRRPFASRPPPPLPRRDLTLLTSVLTAFDLTTLQTPPRRSIGRKEGCSTKVYQVHLAKDKDKSAAIAV